MNCFVFCFTIHNMFFKHVTISPNNNEKNNKKFLYISLPLLLDNHQYLQNMKSNGKQFPPNHTNILCWTTGIHFPRIPPPLNTGSGQVVIFKLLVYFSSPRIANMACISITIFGLLFIVDFVMEGVGEWGGKGIFISCKIFGPPTENFVFCVILNKRI